MFTSIPGTSRTFTKKSTRSSTKRTFEIYHDPIESDLSPSVTRPVPPNLKEKETQLNKIYSDNKENWDAVNKKFVNNRKPHKPLKKKKAKGDVKIPVQVLADVTEAYTLDVGNRYTEVPMGMFQETSAHSTRISKKENGCATFSRSPSIINKTKLRIPQQPEESSKFHIDHSVAEEIFAADEKAFLAAQKHIIEVENSTITESKDNITNERKKNIDTKPEISCAFVLTENQNKANGISTRSRGNNTRSKIPIVKRTTQKSLSVAITKFPEKPLDVISQPQKDIDMVSTKQMKNTR